MLAKFIASGAPLSRAAYGVQTIIGNANAGSAELHYRNGQAKLSSWPSGSVR